MNTLLFVQHQFIHTPVSWTSARFIVYCMRALLVSFIVLITLQVRSQDHEPDTILVLDEVVISARRLERFSAGLQVKSIDKESFQAYPGILLSELISAQSTHFTKTYGAGGLATISMRGTAAQHTSIYWNGFNINPPNIDMADLSLLPLFLFNRIDLVSGGNSTLYGNGSIGGSIHLNSQNGFSEPSLQVALSIGQFNDKLIAATAGYTLGRLQLSSSAWYNTSDNDFEFVNTTQFNKPKQRLENADATHTGIMQELHLPVNAKQHVKAGFWYQDREAGIPPSMTMNRSVARQHDRMHRAYAQWNIETKKTLLNLKSGYTHDFLHYTDSLTALDSEISIGAWTSEFEFTWQFMQQAQLTTGINYQLFNARVDAYPENVNPNQVSVFFLSTYEIPSLKWLITAGARQEMHSDFKSIQPALSLGWKGRLSERLSSRLNVSSNYRTPTLNDRYWQPGGNPDLKAETSLNAEAGIDVAKNNERTGFEFSSTAFHSRIKNWITWLPTTFNYWSPENVENVLTYGLEARLSLKHATEKLGHHAEMSYSATRSLYGASTFSETSGKPQLIYTPVHTATLLYSLKAGRWSLQYHHKITGSRYTDRANTNKLPAYNTADVNLAHIFALNNMRLTVNASVKNITNHAYQVIEYRTMPGRTFTLSLIFDLLFNNQSTPKSNTE